MSRHTAPPVIVDDWFALLRGLERLHADRPRIGHAVRPADEMMRLGHAAKLDFAATVVDRIESDAGTPVRVISRHMGLWGSHGALPLHLTEYALERHRIHRDDTLSAFADLFHHRPLSQLYRAWAEAEPCVQADRAGQDAFSEYLGAFAGLDAADDTDATIPGTFLRFMAGRLVSRTRPAEGLEGMLSAMFGSPARVEAFVPGWLPLGESDRLCLGGRQARLGHGVCGTRVPDAAERLRIHLGPMAFDAYRYLLPDRDGFRLLVAIVRRYVGDTCHWDVQPRLAAGAAPRPTLGGGGALGWSLWLGGARGDRDTTDLLLTPATTRTYS